MAVAHLFKSVDILALNSVGSELGSTQAFKDNTSFLIFLIVINIVFVQRSHEKTATFSSGVVWQSFMEST